MDLLLSDRLHPFIEGAEINIANAINQIGYIEAEEDTGDGWITNSASGNYHKYPLYGEIR